MNGREQRFERDEERNGGTRGERTGEKSGAWKDERKDERKGRHGTWQNVSNHVGMTLWFVISTFFILVLAVLLSYCFLMFLNRIGILNTRSIPLQGPLLLFAFTSIILGVFFSLAFSKKVLAPIRDAIRAADELASGNFKVRVDLTGAREARDLTRSFNHMAEELDSLELLRSDFVNNFSHEFKTPIASIRGFARMLQRDDLTADERREYLDIIIDESERLTELATNVLNLSKIENQTILTGQTVLNCTEQLRRTIVLLEPKWTRKDIQFLFEGDEIEICGNVELLEQVWINLLDNAIKFSPEHSVIELLLKKRPDQMILTISDHGPGIAPEAREHIFDKFYQGDTSHAVAGNGLGLAIAKKIVDLHQGTIRLAKTDETGTSFEVRLPR